MHQTIPSLDKTCVYSGFSDTPSMGSTDVVLGWVEENGKYYMMDMYTTGYGSPRLDGGSNQNMEMKSGTIEDGFQTLK